MGICAAIRTNDKECIRRSNSKLKPSNVIQESRDNSILREIIQDLFAKFDKDQDGYLNSEEVQEMIKFTFLKRSQSKSGEFLEKAADRLSIKIAEDKEGKISPEELFKFFKKM